MSNRKEKNKKSIGLRKLLWSSDDEDSDSQTESTVFRRPNTDPNLHTERTNEDLGPPDSPCSLGRRTATRLERDQFFRMLNSPIRVPPCGPLLGSSHNMPSEIFEVSTPGNLKAIDLRKILSIQKVKRGLSSRGERSGSSSAKLTENGEVPSRPEPLRLQMPTLSASNIIPAMLERARSMEEQPSTSSQTSLPSIIRNGLFSLVSDQYDNEQQPQETSTSAANGGPDGETENVDAGASLAHMKEELEQEREAEQEGDQGGEEEIDVGDEERPQPSTSAIGDTQPTTFNADRHRASQSQTATEKPPSRKRRRESQDSNYIPYTVQEFNQCLLRLLECPVCLEWMEPPMSQCRRGHLVCSRCRARLTACPVCRISFSSVRNRAMEGVAELLHYPCRHGCGRGPRLRRREAHEANCVARRYACFAADCADHPLLPLKELYTHIRYKHPTILKTGKSQRFSVKINSELHEMWLVYVDGDLFQLRVDVDTRACGVVVHVAYVGPKCNATNFTYQVAVEGRHERKIVYSRETHSDLDNTSLVISRQDCFYLGFKQALNFVRVENHNQLEKFVDFCVEVNSRNKTENSNEESAP